MTKKKKTEDERDRGDDQQRDERDSGYDCDRGDERDRSKQHQRGDEHNRAPTVLSATRRRGPGQCGPTRPSQCARSREWHGTQARSFMKSGHPVMSLTDSAPSAASPPRRASSWCGFIASRVLTPAQNNSVDKRNDRSVYWQTEAPFHIVVPKQRLNGDGNEARGWPVSVVTMV